MKFEIKNRWDGEILFSIETDTFKRAVEAAVKAKADLRSADLRSANLSSANLSSVKTDLFDVLLRAPLEVDGLINALREGRVDGSAYQGKCACLVGTIANLKHCSHHAIPNLKPDSSRPAEVWFMNIHEGDTPDKNPIVVTTLEWIAEFQSLISVVSRPQAESKEKKSA